jgi:recombinational DNA repair protein (RecF pathway)
MHTIHHTRAVVIRSEPSGEANKRVWLFTEEFGLVVAVVQGVRKPQAKLQGHISDYSVIAADLIKGRNTWRLVSAKVMEEPLRAKARSALARAYVRTISFLERFLVGDGANEELFAHLITVGGLVRTTDLDARIVDALSLWRMLVILGYAAIDDSEMPLFELPFVDAVPLIDEKKLKKIIKTATESIIQSHL